MNGTPAGSRPVTDLARVAVGVDYETDEPWVWTGPRVVDDADDCSGWYVVDVPAWMVDRFEQAKAELEAAVAEIHQYVGYDNNAGRIGKPCVEYIGRTTTIAGQTFADPCDSCGWMPEDHH